MSTEAKVSQLFRNLRRARLRGNIRCIHKWENDLLHAQHRLCPWNPRYKHESLFRIKARIDSIRFRSDYRIEDYKWEWCGVCKDAMVRCPECGNNCCSPMYGRLRKDGTKPTQEDKWEDRVECPVCKLANDVQHFAYRTGKEPKREAFPNADQIERDCDKWWNETFEWLDEEEKKSQEPPK